VRVESHGKSERRLICWEGGRASFVRHFSESGNVRMVLSSGLGLEYTRIYIKVQFSCVPLRVTGSREHI
jgi:hypothetical protein